MSHEIVKGVGLACWASYLINGDASGISDQDRFEADAFASWLGGTPVDVGEDTFFGRPDAGTNLAGDCVEYSAIVENVPVVVEEEDQTHLLADAADYLDAFGWTQTVTKKWSN